MSAEFDVSVVPATLSARPQWLLWRFEPGEKKPKKMPYYVNGKRRSGVQGSTEDRAALVNLDRALRVWEKQPSQFSGVGFAFLPGDGLIGIDLDGMINPESGEITERGRGIIQACNSYTEFSPSGKGVHIIGFGETDTFKSNEVGVEVFAGRQYFTFTGKPYPDTPATINEIDAKTLKRLRATVESGKHRAADAKPSTAPAPALEGRAKVESALAYVSADCGYEDWIQIGMAICSELGEGAVDVWDYWSSRAAKYPGLATIEQHWKSFKPGSGISGATLFKRAVDAGWQPPRAPKAAHAQSSANVPAAPNSSAVPPLPTVAGDETFTADGRRVIRHDPGRLPSILNEVGSALAEFCTGGGSLFRWGAGLSRVYVADADGVDSTKIKRYAGAVTLHPVGAPHLTEIASLAAEHERWDGRSGEYRSCDCPAKVAEAYLARGDWPEIPVLTGFVEAPTLTLDGRVVDQPGYDSGSGLFAAWAKIPGYVTPPRAPTRQQAVEAADVLACAIDTFPFVSPADLSAALAGMILAICRRSMPAAPMLGITAPTPGTGKSLLTDTISLLATGRRASVMSIGHDEVEADKRMAGVLLAGDAMLNLDNVERPLGGDLLCQVLSQPVLKTRPLGGSAMVDVPTCAIIAATGNNLSIQGDLKRRVTMIRMDAKLERPELRAFDGEPHLTKIMRLRGALITAALTIPLAYLAAGSPKVGGPSLGGFEDWDRLCRRPLRWIGLSDPLEASSLLRDQDPDLETTRAVLMAWWGVFAGDEKTAADVVREGMAGGEGFADSAPTHPELREALLMVSGGRSPTSQKLGYWLRAHKDRIVDGYRIALLPPDRNGISRWQVVTGEAGLSEGLDM